MNEFEEKYKLETSTNWRHLEQVPELEAIFLSATILLEKLKENEFEIALLKVKVTQINIISDALCQIQSAMLFGLKNKLFYSVDPLARVGLEHAVNLIYILDDETNQRSSELIRNYIETTIKKSEHWLTYAKKIGNHLEISVARKKLEFINLVKEENAAIFKKAKQWPKTFERFEKCGFEGAYKTIYAMNSDSVHCLSEDIFNFSTLEQYPSQSQHVVKDGFLSQNASLSVYLFAKTLGFFCIGLQKLSQTLRNKKCEEGVDTLLEKLSALLEIHENGTLVQFGVSLQSTEPA